MTKINQAALFGQGVYMPFNDIANILKEGDLITCAKWRKDPNRLECFEVIRNNSSELILFLHISCSTSLYKYVFFKRDGIVNKLILCTQYPIAEGFIPAKIYDEIVNRNWIQVVLPDNFKDSDNESGMVEIDNSIDDTMEYIAHDHEKIPCTITMGEKSNPQFYEITEISENVIRYSGNLSEIVEYLCSGSRIIADSWLIEQNKINMYLKVKSRESGIISLVLVKDGREIHSVIYSINTTRMKDNYNCRLYVHTQLRGETGTSIIDTKLSEETFHVICRMHN